MIARFRWLADPRPRFRWVPQQGPLPVLAKPGPPPTVAAVVGPTGWDAYQVAVEQGFGGTRDEWLDSLRATGLPNAIRGGSF